MSLKVGTVVQYNNGIAIVYDTYPDSKELKLKFLNKNFEVVTEVVTEEVTEASVRLAITTKNTYYVIDNIQTKGDVYLKQALYKLNKIKLNKIGEDDKFDITEFTLVEGGRRRRRKSRRHKKPNHRHKKRRITQRYKK